MTLEMVVMGALSGAFGGFLVAVVTSGIVPELWRHGWRNDREYESNGYVRTFPDPTTPRPSPPPAPRSSLGPPGVPCTCIRRGVLPLVGAGHYPSCPVTAVTDPARYWAD